MLLCFYALSPRHPKNRTSMGQQLFQEEEFISCITWRANIFHTTVAHSPPYVVYAPTNTTKSHNVEKKEQKSMSYIYSI